jgi:hypothetical protein
MASSVPNSPIGPVIVYVLFDRTLGRFARFLGDGSVVQWIEPFSDKVTKFGSRLEARNEADYISRRMLSKIVVLELQVTYMFKEPQM